MKREQAAEIRSQADQDTDHEEIILGGGCFWCLEAVYERIEGVYEVSSGYAGGIHPNPSYEAVSTGDSGHAEVLRIRFKPSVVSLESLLETFWKIHDPTTYGRQGADIGSQYRSVIFYTDEKQRSRVEASIAVAQRRFSNPIVTELEPAPHFWPAEEYHQGYYRKHPYAGYCRVVVAGKLKKAGFQP